MDAFTQYQNTQRTRARALARAGETTQRLLPKRNTYREAKKASAAMRRESQPDSMLNMGQPARHIPLPRFPSERERVLFANHERRKAAGWIRG